MTLTELRYIVVLAEEQHFGRTAERCHVSQPTLSVAVRKLEEELGIELGGLELIRIDDSPEAFKQNITFAYRAWVDELLELHCDGAAVGEVQDLKWMKVSEVEEHEWAFEHGVMIQRDLMGEFEGRI